ncbi:hypothetical protein D3C77_439380 [compost metagenome]
MFAIQFRMNNAASLCLRIVHLFARMAEYRDFGDLRAFRLTRAQRIQHLHHGCYPTAASRVGHMVIRL